MPVYIFKNPKTGQIKEIVQPMNSDHVYSEDGIQWERIFTIPLTSIDSEIDAMSEKSFCDKTKNKNYTLGDLWDKSKEMSEKRKTKEGIDTVQESYFAKYSKDRKGKKHPNQRNSSGENTFLI